MLESLEIAGFRSVVDVQLDLGQLTVVLGANGTGKSNLYQSLAVLQAAARGTLAAHFAAQGGLASALWAGPRSKGPVRMTVAARWQDLGFTLELGLPTPPSPFPTDPVIKRELVTAAETGAILAERTNRSAMVRDDEGTRTLFPVELWESESLLSQVIDPRRLPVPADIRDRILSWRLYHQLRSDSQAACRRPRTLCFTPVLDPSGDDLAAAWLTIDEIGDADAARGAIADAFPGAAISVAVDDYGQGLVQLTRPGLRRPLSAAELSDGTIRFLALAVALTSPRPPGLLALNEPETSLHPSLLGPLAGLIGTAARRSQVWITTHSRELAAALAKDHSARVVEIDLVAGRTEVRGEAGTLVRRVRDRRRSAGELHE